MNADPLWMVAAFAAPLVSFLAVGSRALRDFSRTELREICQRRGQPERFGEILRNHGHVALGLDMLNVFVTTLLVCTLLTLVWKYRGVESALTALGVIPWALLIGLVMVTVRVALPWTAARLGSATLLYPSWPLWRWLALLALPFSTITNGLDAVLHRVTGRSRSELDEESLEEEIRTIVTEGHCEGLLEDEARDMIESVMELSSAVVSQVMTPRTEMHMVAVDTDWDELLTDVIECGHTRIPVYGQNRDEIVGVLYVKDLLPELAKRDTTTRRPLRDVVRQPLFVPEGKPIDALLEMFQQVRTHIALVLDEYGGVAGLVTIEDVLEEIVGEIVDEYDDELVADLHMIDENTCEALGRVHVDEVNEALGIDLPEDEDYDTIAGFVFGQLGRIPQVGDVVVWNGSVEMTVVEATRRRIDLVRIKRQQTESLEAG